MKAAYDESPRSTFEENFPSFAQTLLLFDSYGKAFTGSLLEETEPEDALQQLTGI